MSARNKKPNKPARKARKAERAQRAKLGSRSQATGRKTKAKKVGRSADSKTRSAKKPSRVAARGGGASEKQKKKARVQKLKREQEQKAKKRKLEQVRKLALKKRADAERARERKQKELLLARARKEREREQAGLRREREAAVARRARERAQELKELERERARRDKERAKEQALREAEGARKKREVEAQRVAERKEREAEKRRAAEEREAAKEAARRAKEEERARREAEREAYRRAKEAERERLRADREAARRLREGKVARATRAAQRVDGLRVGTTRVYDPSSIPNQSGTTRRAGDAPVQQRLVGVRAIEPSSAISEPSSAISEPSSAISESSSTISTPPPTPPSPALGQRPTPAPPPATASIEQRYRRILERLTTSSDTLKREYEETLEMSWIHHDSALEGVVYTFQELRAAMDPSSATVPDSSLQPVCEEIRRHRQAIAYVRDLGERRRVPLNVDVVKKMYVMLHPEEGDVKSVKYRKDIPQHRLYFHEYAPPDKIAYRVRQIMDWLNGPEAKKMKNPLRVAARVHYDLVRVFPFPNDSGKIARLLMNIVLLRGGYPPSIIHSTERQRYYEALKGQLPVIVQLVSESILNALSSIEKRLDDEDRQAS